MKYIKVEDVLKYFDEQIKKENYIPEINQDKEKSEIDIIYPLIGNFSYAHIYHDLISEEIVYELLEPELSYEEKFLIEKIKKYIIDDIYKDPDKYLEKDHKTILMKELGNYINKFKIETDKNGFLKYYYYLWRDMLGLEKLEPLFYDIFIEDISCDGYDIPIYVHHSKYGILRSNIIFSRDELDRFTIKLAQKTGKNISYAEPLLDATLPDGSRINITYTDEITTKGPTFTIRKFKKQLLSLTDLIKDRTLDTKIAAYLWTLIEARANILISGSTSSGKTTLLNVISQFIPPDAKVISIEDTRELQLYHDNWIPATTRRGFNIGDRYYGEVNMYNLLAESFRQNPDYVIVGEVRGEEAYVMFQGMASGHAALSTIHTDTWKSLIRRLTTPPINLPVDQVALLDAVIFMIRARNISPSARRVREAIEVGKYKNNEIEAKSVIRWDFSDDKFETKDLGKTIEDELRYRLGYKQDIEKSIKEKEKIIKYLLNKNIRDQKKISNYIKLYYIDKDSLLSEIE
ncbi:archaeal flagellar protein FlaI [Nanobdella aerobiophila]|uniref:Archaeal flagellar protein FlaI n=1 Tax=Nanobdella aerobiophila TaxID=2586965 RepID=A0A915SLA7_9ARCH|nr:type II/IV secretion system ATPase subunit [Nanobdella aerobiophila]BBL45841.1 archaeal flagellar protein FlaI [Nanobdella aerobiophila]